jgi:hypothetical protein
MIFLIKYVAGASGFFFSLLSQANGIGFVYIGIYSKISDWKIVDI